MTNGSHSNHHSLYPRDEREALSALFDGELPPDAARFALKRLDHDAGWRETCGRWQLMGDMLRGEATSVAPPEFARGVMRALEGQQVPLVEVAPSVTAGVAAGSAVRRRWIGGAALAASVAVAAVLAVRPFMQSPSGQAGQLADTTPATALPAVGSQPSDTVGQREAQPALEASTSPRLAVEIPPATSRTARTTRSPQRAPAREATALPSSRTPGEAATSVAAVPRESARPFHPPVDDIVTRPWPRAALSDAAAGALTVDFGSQQAPSPSFYPFEPRLPADAPPLEPQD